MFVWAWMVAATAWAAGPEATIQGSDTVVGTVSVAMAPDELRAHLRDPVWVTGIDSGPTTVTVRERDGDCLIADYVSPNVVAKATYTVRQCATADGLVSEMVEANLFEKYSARWQVTPDGTGSKIVYTVTMRTTLFLPTSFVTRTFRGSVEKMLKDFADKLGSPAPAATAP